MAKVKSQGTTLAYSTDGETFTDLGQVLSASSDWSVADLDGTDLSSTAREFEPGLVDYGTVSITLNLDNADAGQTALKSSDNTTYTFKLTFSDDTTKTFTGYVNSCSEAVEVDAYVTTDITIKRTSDYTVA